VIGKIVYVVSAVYIELLNGSGTTAYISYSHCSGRAMQNIKFISGFKKKENEKKVATQQ